jgi:hypothetical protein
MLQRHSTAPHSRGGVAKFSGSSESTNVEYLNTILRKNEITLEENLDHKGPYVRPLQEFRNNNARASCNLQRRFALDSVGESSASVAYLGP